MQLNLTDDEAQLLKQILMNYLSDLRMEIANTDSYDLREQLKQDESTIKAIADRLPESSASASA